MKKFIKWFKESNRYKHIIAGIVIGAFANDWYCTLYAGIGIATAVEYKDSAWGGKFDLIDLGLTVTGSCVGQIIRMLIL